MRGGGSVSEDLSGTAGGLFAVRLMHKAPALADALEVLERVKDQQVPL